MLYSRASHDLQIAMRPRQLRLRIHSRSPNSLQVASLQFLAAQQYFRQRQPPQICRKEESQPLHPRVCCAYQRSRATDGTPALLPQHPVSNAGSRVTLRRGQWQDITDASTLMGKVRIKRTACFTQ